jgi:hypothetical protein
MAGLALALGGAGCLGADGDASQAQEDDTPVETATLVHTLDAGNGHTLEFFDLGEGQVGVKEQFKIGDNALLEARLDETLTLADMYRRVRPDGEVPVAIRAADSHAAYTMSRLQVIHKTAPTLVPSSPSGIESVASAAGTSCSADLFNDSWSAQWFLDNFANPLNYTCPNGDFKDINSFVNKGFTQTWAGGSFPYLLQQFEGDFNVAGSLVIYRNGFGLPANIPIWSGPIPPRNVLRFTVQGGWSNQTNHADGRSFCGHAGMAQVWCH